MNAVAVADAAARPRAPTLSNACAAATTAWLPAQFDRPVLTVPASDLAASPVA